MYLNRPVANSFARTLYFCSLLLFAPQLFAQEPSASPLSATSQFAGGMTEGVRSSTMLAPYFDPVQGLSSDDIVRRAIAANGGLAAARLEIEKARGRLRQASLRPNPVLDFEQMSGSLTGSKGQRETSITVEVPIELGGKRQRRIDLGRAEMEAIEAEVAERERQLANEVLIAFSEALVAIREIEIIEQLGEIDAQTVRFVQARLNEGDAAPIELNLLRVEVDRLRSHSSIAEGRLQTSMFRLRSLAGIPLNEPLRLRETLQRFHFDPMPPSIDVATEIALRERPDLKLARLNEFAAQAGLRLAKSQGSPDLSFSTTYAAGRSAFDDTPIGPLTERDKTLAFRVAIKLPIFNRNQGAKQEAAVAVTQARVHREYVEQLVRLDVASALKRFESVSRAVDSFERSVIARSEENIRAIRAAYQLGEFRITDLIAEQRRLLDSQREFTNALAERFLAFASFQTALGNRNGPRNQK